MLFARQRTVRRGGCSKRVCQISQAGQRVTGAKAVYVGEYGLNATGPGGEAIPSQ